MPSSISQTPSRTAAIHAAMKTLPFILFALAMLSLTGCTSTPLDVVMVGAGVGMYETKRDEPPPADLSLQTAQHESWCYETAGYPECYAYPVKDANARLINVDPPNRYPLTARSYHEAVIESQQP
jgi:hypothetical protein